ncbi:MAG: hypothetical protein JKY92_05945 [Magnetovibrio sp.]|nr:hypothetical protein [Magnetovibrio sp.]
MSEQNTEESEVLIQVGNLQGTLSQLSQDIVEIGGQATQRLDEMESMAAHIMAIESVLAVMLKQHPVDAKDVHDMVVSRTAELSGNKDGSPSVQAVAADIAANA